MLPCTAHCKESYCNTAQRPHSPRLCQARASTKFQDGGEAQFGHTQAGATGGPLHPTHMQRCVKAWGCSLVGEDAGARLLQSTWKMKGNKKALP